MRNRTGWRFLWITVIVLLLDQLSKFAVLHFLTPYQPLVLTPFFNLMLAFNQGAAFSFFSQHGELANVGFIAIAISISLVILWMLYRASVQQHLNSVGLCFILGGALGNVVDRLHLGAVVDFLVFHYQALAWPAFNIADSAIFLGIFLVAIAAFKGD